ncbi:gamma-glutamylaminecyclotransferase isoform X1 [Ixodes scapularis]|uniref:Gamma-glutamylcyclotransferase family protein n=1 Tax=Ixodes scapularis TaxID=6945 RepID=B7QKW7_IXOSC|nr:gamma-glutamylaminecyclotransferase isoform X1 [Ixodes scapularis]EEC19489.1 conserved hypothetical protein [Ixodes scapularis]|eukprot:XP_002415822.1 conserved hypothetical protein [Ixodes scapularis]
MGVVTNPHCLHCWRQIARMSSTLAAPRQYCVFVYGTLKTGEPNYAVMRSQENGHAELIGRGKTVKRWPLVIGSSFNIPYLLPCEGRGHNVSGEIYSVDEKMLHFLDEFEGHPQYYVRTEEEVQGVDLSGNSIRRTAWIYFLKSYKEELLSKPYLEDYSSKGDHGLEYVERYLRKVKDPKSAHREEVQCTTYGGCT